MNAYAWKPASNGRKLACGNDGIQGSDAVGHIVVADMTQQRLQGRLPKAGGAPDPQP